MASITAEVQMILSYFQLMGENSLGLDIGSSIDREKNGVVRRRTDGVQIMTGAVYGPAEVTLEVHGGRPVDPAEDEWEDIGECSTTFESQAVVLADAEEADEDFPRMILPAIGEWRVRVHCRGRDLAFDSGAFEPDEKYLIQLWPEAESASRTVKSTSEASAEYIYRANLPRRPDSGTGAFVTYVSG